MREVMIFFFFFHITYADETHQLTPDTEYNSICHCDRNSRTAIYFASLLFMLVKINSVRNVQIIQCATTIAEAENYKFVFFFYVNTYENVHLFK